MEYIAGKKYYFWNRNSHDLDCLYIYEVFDNYFTFYHDSHLLSCSFSHANGKLFEHREDLPGYQDWWNREHLRNLEKRFPKQEEAYNYHDRFISLPEKTEYYKPDTFVQFGD